VSQSFDASKGHSEITSALEEDGGEKESPTVSKVRREIKPAYRSQKLASEIDAKGSSSECCKSKAWCISAGWRKEGQPTRKLRIKTTVKHENENEKSE